MEELVLNVGDKGTYIGKITQIIYIGDKDYTIASVKLEKGPSINIAGTVPGAAKGDTIKINGTIIENSKYGKQIKVSSCENMISTEERATIRFLSELNGVGPATATMIVKKLGTDLAEVLTDKKLSTIPNIGELKRKNIIEDYKEKAHLLDIYMASNGEISLNQALKLYNKYKKKAVEIIKNEPYSIIHQVKGFGFATVDKLALKMGYRIDSNERIGAALYNCLEEAANEQGHCYLTLEEIRTKATEEIYNLKNLKSVFYIDTLGYKCIPDITEEWENSIFPNFITNRKKRLDNIINSWGNTAARDKAIKAEKLSSEEIDTLDYFYNKRFELNEKFDSLLFKDAIDGRNLDIASIIREIDKDQSKPLIIIKGHLGEDAVQTKDNFIKECSIAEKLQKMLLIAPKRKVSEKDIDSVILNIESTSNIEMDEDQIKAVKTTLNNRVSIITGGPGRGKTTILKAAAKSWLEHSTGSGEPKVILLAPTGRAASRMSEAVGLPASTIHRYIAKMTSVFGGANGSTLIFIDETSMMDLSLASVIIPIIENAQVCFVGDVDQLPSIGAGNFLNDLIISKTIPCTKLTKCHRNAGSILDNSDVINNGGRIQELKCDEHFKTLWIPPTQSSQEIADTAIKIYLNNVEKYGISNMVLLAAMRERGSGVNSINNKIQESYNPPSPEKGELVTHRGALKRIFRLGDRVIHTKNDMTIEAIKNGTPIMGVFNGETGIITNVDENANTLEVTFDDNKVATYKYNDLAHLDLAYALTYHKSQGSEYKFVICTLSTADYIMLMRKILYTGESRAKDKCVFVGHAKAFYMAISNVNAELSNRHTTLADKLIEYTA